MSSFQFNVKNVFLLYLININICCGKLCPELITELSSNMIYIFENNNKYNKMLNDNFIKMLDPQLNKEIVRGSTECPVTMDDMIFYSKMGLHLINLDVKDFFNYNLNTVTETLSYAGNYSSVTPKYVDICKSTNKTTIDQFETCEPVKENISSSVKLVSKTIEDRDDKLFKAALEFDGNFVQQKVVICNPALRPYNNAYSFRGLYEVDPTCDVNEDVFVIIAPNPKYIELPTDTPVIYYEESVLMADTKDNFVNAIAGVEIENVKHAILFFLRNMGWNRIAIVTDDSEVNRHFEEQLMAYLLENDVALTSETCLRLDCDFDEIFETLEENAVKVVIANVDQKNSIKLQRSSVIGYKKKWIVRDWSVWEAADVAQSIGDIFVVSPRSIGRNCLPSETKYCNAIEALNILMKTGKFCKYCDFTNRDVAQNLSQIINSYSSYEFIKVSNAHTSPKPLGTITFKNNKITQEPFAYPYKAHVSDLNNCVVRSGRIKYPCNDKDLLLLMMMVAVFFVTVLGIVYFFQSPISYQRFP